MNDKPKILVGLAAFLGLATFPMWWTLVSAEDASPPDLEPPGGSLLFSVESAAVGGGSEDEIDWQRLQAEFQKREISLPAGASLTEDPQGGKWRIDDDKTPYLIVKRGPTVNVYDGRCVNGRKWMAERHMDLLIQWRDAVVREGESHYTSEAFDHRQYEMSLTNTCLKCHTNREGFCTRCHEYVNVVSLQSLQGSTTGKRGIRCWDCHVEP